MNENGEKTILVSGTSRGIGLELARHFLEAGYRVLGVSRSETPLSHERFRHLRADLARAGEIGRLQDAIRGHAIAGMVHNAAIHGPIGPFESNDLEEWVRAFQVNLFAGAMLAQLCIPSLKKNRGFMIFLSGGGSGFGRPNFSAYGVSKTAVVRFAEVLARELAPDVLVYCVAPGPNRTRLLEEAIQGGEVVPEREIVDFGYLWRLIGFLAQNRDERYSGKFIHVRDNYRDWDERQLAGDGYTLRRVKI